MIEHNDGAVRCLFLGRDESLPMLPNIFSLTQVHGDGVVWASGEGHQLAGVGDALLTRDKHAALQVRTADCIPILLYDSAGTMGAVHAGWRGLQKKILSKAVLGLDLSSLRLVVGPFIGAISYEVGEDVASKFAAKHSTLKNNGKFLLNLKSILQAEMSEVNIDPSQVTWFDLDTLTRPEWYSARRGDAHARNIALIWRD